MKTILPASLTQAKDVLRSTLGRVSVARMATVKPQGWVHASLQKGAPEHIRPQVEPTGEPKIY